MSKDEKLLKRLLSKPKDFTWDELAKVLSGLGYKEKNSGKTSGSRRKFIDEENRIISLHKPHPSNIVKSYALEMVIEHLVINEKIEEI